MQMGGGRTDKRRLKKAIEELGPIQASCNEIAGQVNQGIIVEALKNQMFTRPAGEEQKIDEERK